MRIEVLLAGVAAPGHRLSSLYLSDPIQAQLRAQTVTAKCLQLAENAADLQLWEAAINLLSTIFEGKMTGKELVEQVHALEGTETNYESSPILRNPFLFTDE